MDTVETINQSIDEFVDVLMKKWHKEYNRVQGQTKDKGTASKRQYRLMQAAVAGKVADISAADGKAYLENSSKGGEGLPETGTGGKVGEHKRSKEEKKKDEAKKAEDDYVDYLKDQQNPKVTTFNDRVKQIKSKYKEKKPKSFDEQVADIKQKYATSPMKKSRDLFYAKVEGCLEKSVGSEELISNMMDMDLLFYEKKDDTSLGELYKSADRYFDALLTPEEQVVYELSYMAKDGCETSLHCLVKFLDEMNDELLKSVSIEDFVTETVQNSMRKCLEGGLSDGKNNAESLALYHGVPLRFMKQQLDKGIQVEYEHTNDEETAKKIATDHLMETPHYYQALEDMEEALNNGEYDDKMSKSNYGPKGAGLYSERDNIQRKSRRVGTVHEDVGQNKAEQKYTPAVQGTFAEQAKREAKRDQKASSHNPVRIYTDEEKKKLQEQYAKKPDKKEASEDNSKVKGKVNGESYRMCHGYKRVTSGKNRGKYLHRIEAEKRLGRKLSSDQEVHHVDGNRAGTKNTKVSSKAEHTAETNKKRSKSKNGYSGDHRVAHTGSH